jgi:CRISPR type III-A-associated protein Csm2
MDKKPKTYKSFGEMGQRGTGGRGGGGRSDAPPELPPGYLASGYFDRQENLLKEVFIDWPESLTRSLRESRPPATKNSLRAFYSMLRMAKTQFDAQRESQDKAWGDAKTQLYKLQTAAQYQRTRNVISRLCQKFINTNINTVLREGSDSDRFARNFNAFVEHFQAVIAYLPERGER